MLQEMLVKGFVRNSYAFKTLTETSFWQANEVKHLFGV